MQGHFTGVHCVQYDNQSYLRATDESRLLHFSIKPHLEIRPRNEEAAVPGKLLQVALAWFHLHVYIVL